MCDVLRKQLANYALTILTNSWRSVPWTVCIYVDVRHIPDLRIAREVCHVLREQLGKCAMYCVNSKGSVSCTA